MASKKTADGAVGKDETVDAPTVEQDPATGTLSQDVDAEQINPAADLVGPSAPPPADWQSGEPAVAQGEPTDQEPNQTAATSTDGLSVGTTPEETQS
jgi:hypothetical protein